MALLIDGYNLLNAVGIIPRGVGPGTLERARLALLDFLAESLDEAEAAQTTVVFDAGDAPRGLPRVVEHRGVTVRFAAGYEDAEALIEELIRADSAPRRLTVVSSDHRVQRAARRRKAKAIDSRLWYAETVRRRRDRQELEGKVPAKPDVPLLEEEVARWLRQFGGEAQFEKLLREEQGDAGVPFEERSANQKAAEDTASDKPSAEEAARIGDPFPPGYGEDLLEDESWDDPLNRFPPDFDEDVEP